MRHPNISETTRKMTLLVLAVILPLAATTASSQTYTDLYNFGTNSGDPGHVIYWCLHAGAGWQPLQHLAVWGNF